MLRNKRSFFGRAVKTYGSTELVGATIEAAALAEAGDFKEAIRFQKRALELAPDEAKLNLKKRLELFEAGKPFHMESGAWRS